MSVWQILTIAVLMHFVITPTDPLIVHASLDIKEIDITVQVLLETFSLLLLLFIFFGGFQFFYFL